MNIKAAKDIRGFLNQNLQLGQTSYYSISNLEIASARRYHFFWNKVSNSFYDGLLECYPLPSNVRISYALRADFAPRVDKEQEYNHRSQYDLAWQNSHHTAVSEIITIDLSVCRNILKTL